MKTKDTPLTPVTQEIPRVVDGLASGTRDRDIYLIFIKYIFLII